MHRARRPPFWLVLALLALVLLSACGGSSPASGGTAGNRNASARVVNVVAAENFYGDIVKQIGGSRVDVLSILSDPNVEPHQYESNVENAKAVSKADLVVENGGGYDAWMDKLLSASPNSNRVVLKGFDLATTKLPDNEHVWYSIENAQVIATAITDTLKKLDSADAATFDTNLNRFKQSLQQVTQKIGEIKGKYNGTPVGLTETIFLYQTGPLGLTVLTPGAFQKSVAEGNDPPASDVVMTDNQVKQKKIRVLIYNEQTVTPMTTRLQNDARATNIPIIPVTETMPKGKTYQQWMLDQLNVLEQGLAK